MLKVGIIGLGNAGNQIAALAADKLKIPVMAINTSEKDLETLPGNIPKKLIGASGSASVQGAGKDREKAKEYLKDSVMALISQDDFIDFLKSTQIMFVVSSTGGGTGSGIAPIMTALLLSYIKNMENHQIITIGILPVYDEAYSAQVNTVAYFKELHENVKNCTYMIYDNDKYADKPSHIMMDMVNNDIVEDINVIRGYYNYSTKRTSLDDADIFRLMSFSGRAVVSRAMDLKERDLDRMSLEELLIQKLKGSSHAELQRDKNVTAVGVITNLNESMLAEFNVNTPAVRSIYGEPLHNFTHEYVNEDRKMPNNLFLIMTGLSSCVDRLEKIKERVKEIEGARSINEDTVVEEEDHTLDDMMRNIISKDKKHDKAGEVNLENLFASFGVGKK